MTALNRTGFASIPTSSRIDDGLALYDAYIVMAVRCAPPENAPEPEEITRCLDHLDAEVAELPRVQVVVALGKIAFDVWLRLLKRRGAIVPSPISPRCTSKRASAGETRSLVAIDLGVRCVQSCASTSATERR